MRTILAMVSKELRQSFGTPAIYLILSAFSLGSSFFFLRLIHSFGQAVGYRRQLQPELLQSFHFSDQVISPLMLDAAILLMMVIPVLTARMLAEERRDNTLALLMTTPVTAFQLVMGKYLATLFWVLIMALLVLFYPLLLSVVAQEGGVDWGLVFTGWLGLILAGAAFTGIGLFISSLTSSPLLACFISWSLLSWLWAMAWAASATSGATRDVLLALSSIEHLNSFCSGVLDAKDFAYYLTMSGLGLFLTHQSIQTLRWR